MYSGYYEKKQRRARQSRIVLNVLLGLLAAVTAVVLYYALVK